MKYCIFCGEKIEEDSEFCPNCGAKQERITVTNEEINASNNNDASNLSIIALIFAFVFPIVGLILGIIGMSKAKNMSGKGYGLSLAAVIIAGLDIVMTIVVLIIVIVFGGALVAYSSFLAINFLLFWQISLNHIKCRCNWGGIDYEIL